MPLIPAAIAVAVAAILCFLPLFDLLGYESAAAMGAVLGIIVLVRTARLFDTGALAPPLAGDRRTGPLDDYLALLPGHLALVLPPAGLLLLNALRVRNCDISLGIAFWGVIPAVSVVAGQALAFGVAWLPRFRVLAGLALVLAQTGAFLWRLAWNPPIAGHTWTIGWFAGSIYDEALSLPRPLLWARLGVVVGSAAIVLALELAWSWRTGQARGRGRVGSALGLCVLVLATLHHQRAPLGIQHDQASVKRALGGRLETEHFVIWYDPGALDDAQRVLIAEDHEFRYAELAAFFDEDPVAWRGRRIDSFVYPSRNKQQRLMGSRRTLVARPWTHQMHIRWSELGDTALAHELAHLFTAPFGTGPLQLAMRFGGLVPDMAMIEGIASAADAGPDELTAHQASRAMRELGIAPDLRRLFDPAGFWSQPGRRAYTTVSSFVQWLIATRGIADFKRAYGSGDLASVYGEPVADLVTQWEAWVDQVPLTDGQQALAGFRYRKSSIFSKVCARTLAELGRLAEAAEEQGDLQRALLIRQEIGALQPNNPDHRLEIARLRRDMGELDAALLIATRLLSRGDLGPVRTVRIQELAGDLRWEQGQPAGAAATYGACLADGLDEARQRRLAAKLGGAGHPSTEVQDRARRYLLDDGVSSSGRLWSALRWAQAAPDDPLPRYLVGRTLHQAGEHSDATAWLAGPRGTLDLAALDDERWLLLADAAMRADQLLLAEGTYRALLVHSDSSRARTLAEEGLLRVRWKRTGSVE